MSNITEPTTEAEFLARYDASDYERPSLTVDLVLMCVLDGELAALVQQRHAHPFKDQWALPGGFVGPSESLDDAAARVLAEKARMRGPYIEQLYSFGAVDRDPRTRVVTVAYFALLPAEQFDMALATSSDLKLARIELKAGAGLGGTARARSDDRHDLPLAFDHADILALAVRRLRGKLDYAPIAFALLPARFTLRQLQNVHEAILGMPLNKPAFRRRQLDMGWLEGTGKRQTGTSFRPAELFRFKRGP